MPSADPAVAAPSGVRDSAARGWPRGWRLIALDAIDSTNRHARELAAEGAAHGTVVTARRQDRGRGRYGRDWVSPEGNLYVSVLLRPPVALEEAGQLTFVAALSTADALAAVAPAVPTALKWPNDVLARGRKIAGILLESEPAPDFAAAWVVVGVGVNLASHPEGVMYPATDLAAAGAPGVTAEAALAAFAAALDSWYRRWREDGFAAVRQAWLARAAGLGAPIRVQLDRETLSGIFAGLDTDGSLLLDRPCGERRRIAAGDVFLAAADEAAGERGEGHAADD
jgi:BirA family biotin operon repressor/biotin-[acetyl-CoA-carboxylase] ligase